MLRPSLLPGLIDACAHNRRRERATSGCSRSAAASRARRRGARGRVRLVRAPRGAALVGAGRAGRLLRREGRRRAALRGASALDASSSPPRDRAVPGRAAVPPRSRCGRRRTLGVVGQLRPAIAEARGFPAGEEIYVAEIDLDALGARRLPTDDLRAESLPRFPSIVRDISISSTKPCLPPPFVALSVRRLRRRWSRSSSSIATRERASGRPRQPVAAPHVPRAGSHVDRRRGAGGDRAHRRGAARPRTARERAIAVLQEEQSALAKATGTRGRSTSSRSIGWKRKSSCSSA